MSAKRAREDRAEMGLAPGRGEQGSQAPGWRAAATVSRKRFEGPRDLPDVVERSRGDRNDEVVGRVVVGLELDAVLRAEHLRREPCPSLVAIDEGMVSGERVQERCCLGEEIGIGVLAEDACPRSVDGCFEKPHVADVDRSADSEPGDAHRLFDREVVGHSPSRRSSSA